MKKPDYGQNYDQELAFIKGRKYQENCFNSKSFVAGITIGFLLALMIIEFILN